jgi:hypothetical protein
VKFQEDYFAEHMANVDDDLVPYFGTGVLATAFGCVYKPSTGQGDDPYIYGPVVHTIENAAKLKMPDPYKDGILPKYCTLSNMPGAIAIFRSDPQT